jgi:hypothetical protein
MSIGTKFITGQFIFIFITNNVSDFNDKFHSELVTQILAIPSRVGAMQIRYLWHYILGMF